MTVTELIRLLTNIATQNGGEMTVAFTVKRDADHLDVVQNDTEAMLVVPARKVRPEGVWIPVEWPMDDDDGGTYLFKEGDDGNLLHIYWYPLTDQLFLEVGIVLQDKPTVTAKIIRTTRQKTIDHINTTLKGWRVWRSPYFDELNRDSDCDIV